MNELPLMRQKPATIESAINKTSINQTSINVIFLICFNHTSLHLCGVKSNQITGVKSMDLHTQGVRQCEFNKDLFKYRLHNKSKEANKS